MLKPVRVRNSAIARVGVVRILKMGDLLRPEKKAKTCRVNTRLDKRGFLIQAEWPSGDDRGGMRARTSGADERI